MAVRFFNNLWRELFNKDMSAMRECVPVDMSSGFQFFFAGGREAEQSNIETLKEMSMLSPFRYAFYEIDLRGEGVTIQSSIGGKKGATELKNSEYRLGVRVSSNPAAILQDKLEGSETFGKYKLHARLEVEDDEEERQAIHNWYGKIAPSRPAYTAAAQAINTVLEQATESEKLEKLLPTQYFQLLEFFDLTQHNMGFMAVPRCVVWMLLDREGKFISVSYLNREGDRVYELGKEDLKNAMRRLNRDLTEIESRQILESTAQHIVYSVLRPLLFGIGLTHCKNVELVTAASTYKPRRPGEKSFFEDFREIKIKPITRSKKYTNRGEGEGGRRAQHLVRGHFRVYTEQSKLFGKYVGRFYIPPHLAGDAESGIIHHSYNVDTSPE